MWISKHWLCLVYKCRSEQILQSWEDIFPLLLQIYTGPYSDTHHKQRTFGSIIGRPVFVGTCRSGPRFMAPPWQWWVTKVYRWEFLQWQILPQKEKSDNFTLTEFKIPSFIHLSARFLIFFLDWFSINSTALFGPSVKYPRPEKAEIPPRQATSLSQYT